MQQPVEPAPDRSRYWLYAGITLLVIAVVYSGILLVRARAKSAAGSAALAAAVAANTTQVKFVPEEDAAVGESLGAAGAPVVVREFADFQCPACGAFEPILEKMRKDYVDTGRVRFVFFDYPLDIHKNAMLAAQVARCAGSQGHYWSMHDLLYAQQQDWAELPDPLPKFQSYAQQAGVDPGALLLCIRTGATHDVVLRSQGYGDALGINSTPSYGVNGAGYAGVMPYDDFRKLIEQQYALAKKPASSGKH